MYAMYKEKEKLQASNMLSGETLGNLTSKSYLSPLVHRILCEDIGVNESDSSLLINGTLYVDLEKMRRCFPGKTLTRNICHSSM